MLNIIMQSYTDTMVERNEELGVCLLKNLKNRHIRHIYDLTADPVAADSIPESHKGEYASKYTHIHHAKWLTYESAFAFANIHASNAYYMIINRDIYLDAIATEWHNACTSFADNGYILALSRHEADTGVLDAEFAKLLHAHTQDAWLFKTPVHIRDCAFEIGLPGCDNALAHRIRTSGYKIINKPQTYRIFHIDRAHNKDSATAAQYHKENTSKKIKNQHPEDRGYVLVPNYDAIYEKNITLDRLAQMLGYGAGEIYELMIEMMTSKIRIRNH
jgi:hypothetical protein